MLYEFRDLGGNTTLVDTSQIDYRSVWNALSLNKRQMRGANRVIELYHSADFSDGVIVVDAHSWMKPYNREAQRH